MKTIIASLITTALLITGSFAAEEESPSSKTVAIFIANRADATLNDQMPVFEDMITAQITDLGYEVISRGVVLDAVGDLLKKSKKNDVDALLDDQTSALRLSQNLGANYLLFASLMGMDKETRVVNAYDVNFKNDIHTLRASYRVLDGNTGGSLTSGMVNPSRTIQQTKHSQTVAPDLIRELLGKASIEIAADLSKKEKHIRVVDLEKSQVEFQIGISLSDVNFPQAEIDHEGNVTITANQATIEPLAVTVELDGFSIGTTGRNALNNFTALPGLHRIRLVRNDLVPYERMINIHEGMQLNIAMQLNDEGLLRWRENTEIFNELMRKTKLNDAEVELLRGEAQMLRQSGYKIDIQVDTDEAITIENNQSLLNQKTR